MDICLFLYLTEPLAWVLLSADKKVVVEWCGCSLKVVQVNLPPCTIHRRKPHPIDGQYFSKFRAAGTLHHFVEPECGFVSFTNLHTWTKRLQNMVTGNESVKDCDIAYDLQKWCPTSIRDLILLWKFGPPMHLLPARSTTIWDTNSSSMSFLGRGQKDLLLISNRSSLQLE